MADSYASQPETDETNNVRALPIAINVGDLTIANPVAPASFHDGEVVPVSFDVKNLGPGTVSPGWYDSVYLSDLPALTGNSVLVGSFYEGVTTLLPNGVLSVSGNITIPSHASLGASYLVFVADSARYKAEGNETNNLAATQVNVLGQSDLSVTGSASPPALKAGDTANVSFTVTNTGSATASGAWTDAVYYSTNSFFDASAVLLASIPHVGQPGVAVGDGYSVLTTVTIPPSSTGGTHHFFFVADIDNALTEADETNNTRTASVAITPLPDLVITNQTAPASGRIGGTIAVSYTVKNTGTADAVAGAYGNGYVFWYDSVYLSDDAVLDPGDTLLDSNPTGSSLSPGGSYINNRSLTIPATGTGSRFLLFVTDATNQIPESGETNNVNAVPITINATDVDLSVTAANSPANATVGDVISVSYTVKNIGATAASAIWYDAIYLSDTPTLTASSLLISAQQRPNTTPLAAGASYANPGVFFLVPTTASPTTKYILVVTDVYNQQGESDEQNVRAIPFTLNVPDLAASQPSAPTTAVAGVPFSVSFTVTNNGPSVGTKAWSDAVYISSSPTFDGNATRVSTVFESAQTPLGVGGSYTALLNVTLDRTTVGPRYLFLVADAFTQSGDVIRGNNVVSMPIDVRAPDLKVTAASASTTSASVSGQVQVSWTVTNQGNAAGPATWSDKIYLSDKPTFDFSATSIASLSRPTQTPLAVGDSYSLALSVTIPPTSKTGIATCSSSLTATMRSSKGTRPTTPTHSRSPSAPRT